MSKLSYWKDANTWICSKHLPSIEVPSSSGACPFVGCDSIRPRNGRPTSGAGETTPPSSSASSASASVRPPTSTTPTKTATPAPSIPVTLASLTPSSEEVSLCSWLKCDKGSDGGPAIARARSKYCSKDCSNKNARHRYKTKSK